MNATNLLVICSDEHNKRFLGCYGHEMVQTPNLDEKKPSFFKKLGF